MNMQTLNWWAILVAAVSAFLVGGLWYSPALLGKMWKRANGFGVGQPVPPDGKIFAITFLLSLIMSFNLAMFLNDPKTNMAWGATAGFLAGFGWGFMGLGIIAMFERRLWSYVIVNGGYLTVALTLMGAILGAWR
jgi:hypothetical protein